MTHSKDQHNRLVRKLPFVAFRLADTSRNRAVVSVVSLQSWSIRRVDTDAPRSCVYDIHAKLGLMKYHNRSS